MVSNHEGVINTKIIDPLVSLIGPLTVAGRSFVVRSSSQTHGLFFYFYFFIFLFIYLFIYLFILFYLFIYLFFFLTHGQLVGRDESNPAKSV